MKTNCWILRLNCLNELNLASVKVQGIQGSRVLGLESEFYKFTEILAPLYITLVYSRKTWKHLNPSIRSQYTQVYTKNRHCRKGKTFRETLAYENHRRIPVSIPFHTENLKCKERRTITVCNLQRKKGNIWISWSENIAWIGRRTFHNIWVVGNCDWMGEGWKEEWIGWSV